MIAALLASVAYPGAEFLHPTIHFAPTYVSDHGGWHDIAGSITHRGAHHVFQGTGWNHAVSTDFVHWKTVAHGPKAIHETYANMSSYSDPCSGFITKDPDTGDVCAGFRQCGSNQGVAGGQPWDVPLELRCALDDSLLTWNDASPEYLFNVSFWRPIPYDPARPWRESDGNWYMLLSMDGCNTTRGPHPCSKGGMLGMWRSPALRGAAADWQYVGNVFETNATVLRDGYLSKEFVTIDYIGALAGDPVPASEPPTRLFLNNVGGNGGGNGCCSGTTSYFAVTQAKPGAPMKLVASGAGMVDGQGMVDWGAFALKSPTPEPSMGRSSPKALDLLTGTSSRGLSMARTLGTHEADQVSVPGRRVLIGWTGPAPGGMPQIGGSASAQSLPRSLSLAPDRSLLQRFIPELASLRAAKADPAMAGLQAEVVAAVPAACAAATSEKDACGVSLLGDGENATVITLRPWLGLVAVDATSQGNGDVRAGPLPPECTAATCGYEGGWHVHAFVDHSIIEIIVNNATAFVVYASPASEKAGQVGLVGSPALLQLGAATLDVWSLAPANNVVDEHVVESASRA